MPSAEETTYLIEVMPDSGQDSFTSRDVDVLVSRIKENLRLSGFKSRSSLQQKMRPSPYRLPSRSWAEPSGTYDGEQHSHEQQHCKSQHFRRHCRHCNSGNSRKTPLVLEDSYERFQALLRNGALIKEAVKRLQTNEEEDDEDSGSTRRPISTSATSTTLDSMDDDEDEVEDDVLLRRDRCGQQQQQQLGESRDDFLYRRKPFYYDSEDEPLPSVYQPIDL